MVSRESLPRTLGRIAASIVVAFGLVTACSNDGAYQGDAFTAFTPTRDLFPKTPIDSDSTEMVYLVPQTWSTWSSDCPVWATGGADTVKGEWRGVRYDWIEDGEPASWVVSTRASGITGLSPTEAQSRIYRWNNFCVKWFDNEPDIAMRWLDLDGLPEGTIAFELTVDKEGITDSKGNSVPSLHLYGAFVVVGAVDRAIAPDGGPGSADTTATLAATSTSGPTHVLTVVWLAWGTEVPPDQFVATVDELTTAALAG